MSHEGFLSCRVSLSGWRQGRIHNICSHSFSLITCLLSVSFYICFSCLRPTSHSFITSSPALFDFILFFLSWLQIMGISQPQPSWPIIRWLQTALLACSALAILEGYEIAPYHYILSAQLFLMMLLNHVWLEVCVSSCTYSNDINS